MSKRSQQKRQARSKEKAKQLRRERGMSPWERLIGSGDQGVECWALKDVGEQRLLSYTVLRGMRGGGHAAAFFLVDFDCIGLKDGFYRLNVSRQEILERYDGAGLVRVESAEVRAAVAGAIRWTREHRFRLPEGLQRSLKILGGQVDVVAADVSRFGVEGGRLKYIGRSEDLEDRLLDETLEDFMDREDVTCVFMDEAWDVLNAAADGFDDEEEEEDLEEPPEDEFRVQLANASSDLSASIEKVMRQSCEVKGVTAPAGLDLAADSYAMATVLEMGLKGSDDLNARIDARATLILEEIPEETDREEGRQALLELKAFLKALPPVEGESEMGLVTRMTLVSFEESSRRMREKLALAVRRWCHGRAIAPEVALEEGVALVLESMSMGLEAGGIPSVAAAEKAKRVKDRLLELESSQRREELKAAIDQVRAFVESFDSIAAMEQAVGIDDD